MADFVKGLFGGSKPLSSVVPASDSDFADFAGAPDPSPASFSAIPSEAAPFGGAAATATSVPFTKWYNVHERHSLSEFKQEGFVLIAILVIVAVHLIGTRLNRAKAKAWIESHFPILDKEFALVGFGDSETNGGPSQKSMGRALKEKSLDQFATYATGRQNVAFVDVSLTLLKRHNPLSVTAEFIMSFLFDAVPAPTEKMEAIVYPFDGRELLTVPGQLPGAHELRGKDSKSSYDGFVWAIVNKNNMKTLRDERYDVSITSTKDNAKLPNWATVMSEAAEITELLLTPELVKAVSDAGDTLNYLLVTDQPKEKPTTIDETVPRKRIILSTRLAASTAGYQKSLSLFEQFLRLPDLLASSAHFRPEVLRKVKVVREDTIRKIQKADEDEKAEERALEREKTKKLKRDLELKGLDAKAQKKYLEKEKEREQKKAAKKQQVRG